jgi:hypothetical protein
VAKRRLDRDEWHFGFPCAAGTEIDEEWCTGVLGHDFVFRGVVLPKGSQFSREAPNFTGVKLSAATRVHQLEVAGGSGLEFPHWFAAFPFNLLIILLLWPWILASGIQRVVRREVTVIPAQPLAFRVGELAIAIEPNDRIALDRRRVLWLMLSSPRTIGDDELSTGWLAFDAQERWTELMLYGPQAFRGRFIFGSGLVGTEVRMFEDGRLARFVLGEDAEIDGRKYVRGTRVTLDRSGRVLKAKKLRVDVPLYTARPDVDAIARGHKPS